MLHNLLQISDDSSNAKQPYRYVKTSSSKGFHKYKHESCVKEASTYSIDDEIQHSKEISNNQSLNNELEQTRILIAEAENELLVLFREYLASRGINTDTADRGDEALDRFLDRKDQGRAYDAIVVDTHLHSPSGLDVAKRIRSENPDQRIVLVTTTPKDHLPADCLRAAGIKDKDIFTMPFKLSNLVSLLRN